MSEVRDTPITNNHGGTRPAVCGRNVAINIKVTIVRQTIIQALYTRYPR